MTIQVPLAAINEVAGRSEFHARAVTFLNVAQAGIDRQRRIWLLRAEVKKHRDALADAEAALKVEEEEMRLDRQLGDTVMLCLEQASDRVGDDVAAKRES